MVHMLGDYSLAGGIGVLVGLVVRGLFKLAELRALRRTYREILQAAQPGTLIVDRDCKGRQILLVRLPEVGSTQSEAGGLP